MARRRPASRACIRSGSTVWGLDGLPGHVADELEEWLDGLAELTLGEWRAIGQQCLVEDASNNTRSHSDALLEATIVHHRLGVTAWFVRDLVETATHRVRAEATRTSRAAEREVARAVLAAEAAALAIAAQDRLPERDYWELRAPFRRLARAVPLHLA